MLKGLIKYIKSRFVSNLRYRRYRFTGPLEELGSAYGGWTVPTTLLNSDSICYSAGAGEDISFDIALAERFHCNIWIFDPTPRAEKYFENLRLKAIRENQPFIHYLHYQALGVWDRNETVKFFSPKDKTHVSHSISNLQHTADYFEAVVKTVEFLMEMNNHDHLDLLKLDIEGAEFAVIDSVLSKAIVIKILCVEFHENSEDFSAVQSILNKLEAYNYAVVARKNLDFTFVHKNSLI